MKFIVGVIFGVILAVAVPAILVYTGNINMDATLKAGTIERRVGSMAWKKSLAKRAPATPNPFLNDASAVDVGLDHYKENCVVCHGVADIEPGEIAAGLNPHPPRLRAAKLEDMTDGQLFYLIKNGIRATGMPGFGPTHTDDEIWKIAAFLRKMDSLSEAQKSKLVPAEDSEHHHHEEETAPATGPQTQP